MLVKSRLWKLYEAVDCRQVIARSKYEAAELLGETKGYARKYISQPMIDTELLVVTAAFIGITTYYLAFL